MYLSYSAQAQLSYDFPRLQANLSTLHNINNCWSALFLIIHIYLALSLSLSLTRNISVSNHIIRLFFVNVKWIDMSCMVKRSHTDRKHLYVVYD